MGKIRARIKFFNAMIEKYVEKPLLNADINFRCTLK